MSFLLDALRALGASMQELGGDLVVRRGDVVAEVVRIASATGAKRLFVGADASASAQQRLRRLHEQLEVRVPGRARPRRSLVLSRCFPPHCSMGRNATKKGLA
jgi:hypothetical protein